MNISSIGGSTSAYGLAAMQAQESGKARRAEANAAATGKPEPAGTAVPSKQGGTTGDTAVARLAALQTAATDSGGDASATSQNPRLAQAYGFGGPRAGAHLSVMA